MSGINEISGPLPPVFFLGALLGMLAAHFLVPVDMMIVSGWRWLGALLIAVGLFANISGVGQFKKAGTALKPTEPSTVLVVTGPFRYSRNPMYLGMIIVLVGAAVALGSVTPWPFIPVFVWAITARFIIPEERKMERAFGEQYLAYKRGVRRWL